MAFGLALAGRSAPAQGGTNITYLKNGRIRLGLDLRMGGAICYLAGIGGPNLINDFDHGRQVQLSFYSGPVPFQPPGTILDKSWRALGWNPIQAGDAFGHGSRVTSCRNDGKSIRLRCVPLIWPLNNVPAECAFENTYTLSGSVVHLDACLVNSRSDHTQYPAGGQELPAVYCNGPWCRLVSYVGEKPFTGAASTVLVDRNDNKGWPWLGFFATEHWAALLDTNDRGLGVFEPDACRFGGGFAGSPKGTGGPADMQTSYIAPNLDEILDCNITYRYRADLIVGSLGEIRHYAVEHSHPQRAPKWVFRSDRQHWFYEGTTDAGWPIDKELRVNLTTSKAALVSPQTLWQAEEAPVFQIDAAFDAGGAVSLMVQTAPSGTWLGPFPISIKPDAKFHHYETHLAALPGYAGPMRRLKVVLPSGKGWARVRSIGFK